MKTLLVTGVHGMVGSAISKLFINNNYNLKLRCVSKESFDLRNETHVKDMFELLKPNYVLNCAAVVGGIKFNKDNPDILFRDNILINTHIIHYCHHYNVEKLISFSSACAFQDGVYPFKEDNLQDGKPYEGNLAYGYAKRMVDIQTEIYNKIYKRNYLTVIPTSLFGPNDNFSLENGHFISNLIRKTYDAKCSGKSLEIWGDGSPLRELLFSEDLAKILVSLITKETPDKLLIPGQEVSVKEVVKTITEIFKFDGKIIFNKDKPAGQYRKPTDPTRFNEVIKDFKFTPYKEALKKTINWYVTQKDNLTKIRD